MLEDFEMEEIPEPEDLPPEESENRTFLIAAGLLGGITLISLICIAVYAIWYVPTRRDTRATEEAQAMEQNTAIAQAATQTADAAAWTATPSPTPPATDTPPATETPIPTETPVLLDVATEAPTDEVTPDPRTATVEALNTEVALTQTEQAILAFTPTALPDTGFADAINGPGLFAMASVLIVVIYLARRLRAATG